MIRLEIINDSTGTIKEGNYDASLWLPTNGQWVEHRARVEGYDRRLGWDELVREVVDALAPVVIEAEKVQ